MKHITRRSIIAGSVLALFAAPATYAESKPVPPGLLKKTPRATPTDVGPGGASFTSTPTPTLPPSEWTATPTNTASATSTLTRTPAPTKTPTPRPTATRTAAPTATVAGFPYHAVPGERTQFVELLNRERALVSAPALQWHQRGADVAQWKGADMASRRYTGHPIPPGWCFEGCCGDYWAKVYGVAWDCAGIAWQHAGEALHQASATEDRIAEIEIEVFRGSASHWALLVDPQFTHIGVGMAVAEWVNGVNVVVLMLRL
jgi:uncharacterized protein YkwD